MFKSVLVLSDIHGNDAALRAVLDEADAGRFDAVALLGDITWGTFPLETYELLASIQTEVLGVRGNADRALLEVRSGAMSEPSDRDRWMLAAHPTEVRDFLESLELQTPIAVEGFGEVLMTHGSPRGDEELVTPETPVERVREFMAGVSQPALATGHTHVSYLRSVDAWTLFNPGSIGLPYEGKRGGYWATLEDGKVNLHRTDYDVDAFVARTLRTDDPAAEEIAPMLLDPPARQEAIAFAESHVFAG